MPTSPAEYQTFIVTEVGDSPGGVLAANIATIWNLYAGETRDHRHYLLAKKKALDFLMGTVREQVDQTQADTSTALTDKLRNLQAMYRNTLDELDADLAQWAAEEAAATATSRAGVSGQLTTVVPYEHPQSWPDPNAAHLRGDPWHWRP